MPNVNSPFGFSAVNTFNSAPYTGRTNRYFIPSTDGNAYYVGDAVKSFAGADANGIPTVVKITNGTDTPRGVIVSVDVINVGMPGSMSTLAGVDLPLSQASIPASKTKDYYVLVADDPELMMFVQGDATATNQVAANANKNCSFTVTAPSPATNALSASVLTSSTIATTQALNVRLMGLAQIPNNVFGAYAVWVCKWNQHELMGNTAGI